MSLILDALQRAQQEPRDPRDVPGVATAHLPERTPERRWPRALPWIALTIALVGVAWLLFDRMSHSEPVSDGETAPLAVNPRPGQSGTRGMDQRPERTVSPGSAVADRDTQSYSKAKPPVAAKTVSPPSTQQSAADDPAVAALYRRGEKPQLERPQTASATRSEIDSGAGSVVTPGRVENPAQEAASEGVEDPVLDIDALVATAEAVLVQQRLSEHPAPFLSDLSQVDKDAIPTVYYSKHDYTEGGRSTVVLNSKVLAAGDVVGSGLSVEEVLSDSVVLSHHGIQFRLKALNSWVNL